jgi:hypothetical protein
MATPFALFEGWAGRVHTTNHRFCLTIDHDSCMRTSRLVRDARAPNQHQRSLDSQCGPTQAHSDNGNRGLNCQMRQTSIDNNEASSFIS